MNKKYLLTALLVAITVMLCSLPVTELQVRKVAQNLSLERNGQTGRIKSVSLLNQDTQAKIYIVNLLPQGFVLIAGDDASQPILGYDFTGNWSGLNIPVQLQDFINSWQAQLKDIVDRQLVADNAIRAEWQRLDVETSRFTPLRNDRAVAPLIASTWGQGTYYNALCPDNVPVGCVATAMAQIMRYWSFPTVGLGSNTYTDAAPAGYHASYGVQTANFGATTYNWSGMPLSVGSANTSVATLCYHAGVAVNMDYDPTGSGAYSTDVPTALIDHFRYKSTTQHHYKSAYGTDAWDTLMRGELDNARPIYYSGSGPDGGHAFILDGYQSTNYFHLNWGWDGGSNGYYYLSNLNPSGYTFNTGQAAVIGIQPGETITTLSEGFEGTTYPPAGWTVTASTFLRSATAYITGAYSARYSVTGTGTATSGKQLRTLKLTVNATSAPVTFKAKCGATVRGEQIKIGYNTTGSGTYTYLSTVTLSATAQTFTQAVTSLTPGDYYFVFETYATTASNAKLWIIDDVTGPTIWVDPTPIAAINISTWAAGSIAPGTATQSGTTFQLSNVGHGTLTITSVTNLSATEYSSTINPSVTLINGQVHEFGFTYEPINYGTDNQAFQIVTNGGTINISLSGAAVNFQYPEGFESYPDFSLSCSPWSQYDGDGGATYSITGTTFTNQGYSGSFIIFNPSSASPALTTGYETHGGSKYAACMAAVTASAPNNDWLISPPMTLSTSGSLSFWAKSVTATYGLERFKVLYSTTTNAVSAFTNYLAGSALATGYIEAPITWTNYTYTLPQTAKYFAIQCVSSDAFMFMVDDITAPNSAAPILEFGNLNGYVYRSGTTTPISNALITAGSKSAYTNSAGLYQINNLTVGTYSVSCNASGQFYFTATQNANITLGNTTALDFNLTWAELTVNPMTLTASLYTSETLNQNLAISNPGGTANLQYAMWLSSAARSDRHQMPKTKSAASIPESNKIAQVNIQNIDRATGWMGYTNWDDADTYLTAATTNREKATKFYLNDFGMWSNGVTISKLRALFYNPTATPWGTATNFYFKIYGASGTGTALYTSPTYTAVSLTTMECVLATPLLVTTDFWVSVYCVTSGGMPHLVGSSLSSGNSYYGTSSAAWTAVTDFDWCLDAYVTGGQWITASQYSGTVAPVATQNVSMLFDCNGLTAGTKTAYLNIANNANYNSPSTRGDLMVIPVSLTVTAPTVPFLTLNTNTWNTFTTVGTPTTTGNVYTISNVGTGTVSITSMSGLTGTPFTTNFNSAITLTLGQTHSFGFTYTPTAPGVHTATFTIVTNGGTKTITLTANAVGTDYLTEDFENETFPPTDWVSYDVDGDGYNWGGYYSSSTPGFAHSDSLVAGSLSYTPGRDEVLGNIKPRSNVSGNGSRLALTPDNWLVTPHLSVGATGVLTYWIGAFDPGSPAEHYSVMVSTTNNLVASFTTELFSETLVDGDWHQRGVDLSAYANQNIYLAFQHHGCTDQYLIRLDDVKMPPLKFGSLKGNVYSSGSALPIQSATVTINGLSASTDVNGYYEIPGILIGTYSALCQTPAGTYYLDQTVSGVVINANVAITQNFSLTWSELNVTPTSFSVTVNPNETADRSITISNPAGTANLEYAVLLWDTSARAANPNVSASRPLVDRNSSRPIPSDEPKLRNPHERTYGWYGYANTADFDYYTWSGTERATKYVLHDLGLLKPVTIQKISTFFYNPTAIPWVDATFHFVIYAADGTTVLYTSPDLEAVHLTEALHILTTPLVVTGDFYVATVPTDASSSPFTCGTSYYSGNSYDKISGIWTVSVLEYLNFVYAEGAGWLSLTNSTGSVTPGNSAVVGLHFNAAGLESTSRNCTIAIYNNSNNTSARGVTREIPVTFNVSSGILPAPTGIAISLDGNNPKLSWNIVNGTVRYNVYACTEPLAFDQFDYVKSTTNLEVTVTPTDLVTAGITGNKVFFIVTADNAAARSVPVGPVILNNNDSLKKDKLPLNIRK